MLIAHDNGRPTCDRPCSTKPTKSYSFNSSFLHATAWCRQGHEHVYLVVYGMCPAWLVAIDVCML